MLAYSPALLGSAGPNNVQPRALKLSLKGREQIPVVSVLAPILHNLWQTQFHVIKLDEGGGFVVKELQVPEMA